MELFFKDSSAGFEFSWDFLISDLNNSKFYNPYCHSGNYYEVFRQVILSLLLGEEIILLDSDFAPEELLKLTGDTNYEKYEKRIPDNVLLSIANKQDLLKKVSHPESTWSVTLFTSGTTGLPKKVSHGFESISRFVRSTEKHASNVWGFAYNPSHMAGLQVFFQILLNGNSSIRLFGLSKEEIFREIKDNSITNISATPTFYRLLAPFEISFHSVKRVTSGGEKIDQKTLTLLEHLFPEAKIANIYASTEAGSLLVSNGNTFIIQPEYKELIRVENGELLIHMSLVGKSDLPGQEWYNTGDLVEVISTDPFEFRFQTRKNEMINVGGYKVNPTEVEEAILILEGIIAVRVYPKSNSVLGNILCAEVSTSESSLDEKAIRVFLQEKLQEFKIPRIIRFVKEISVTRTGKLNRRAK